MFAMPRPISLLPTTIIVFRFKMQKSSKKKPFDFSKYPRKRIALMFLYLGWHHDGLVRQANTENTVEEHLLAALLKTKLIERPEQGEWSRCGRTDKGVSAFRQVAALTVRSTDVSSKHIFWPEDSAPPELRISTDKELPYVRMLNGVLPKTIRVISCATVDEEFSARHSCTQRTYTYIFPRALVKDVSSMNAACSFLVGEHDFRNFCYIDRAENRLGMTYVRGIKAAHVEELSNQKASDQFDLLKLTIIASGFLWHQIRCIVSLLYEIGCGNEQPELVEQLLDINKFPARPNYLLANELPLCLFDCNFMENSLEWTYEPEAISDLINSLQTIWCEHQVKAANIKMMLDELSGKAAQNDFSGLDGFIRMGPTRKGYMPIAKRTRCSGLDELREKSAVKKARLEFLEPDLD